MQTLKENIKKLVQEQKELKNQRKTVRLVGERTQEIWRASSQHFYNRIKLREMYAALGLIRGKNIEEIESNPKSKLNMNSVKKLIEIHGKTVCSS